MSKDFNSLKGNATHFNKVMDFQARRDTPLLELNRMVLAETYMDSLPLMVMFNPAVEDYVPLRALTDEAKIKGEVMTLPAFNLTKHFGSTQAALANVEKVCEIAARFHALNEELGQPDRGICSIISQHTATRDPASGGPTSEVFLVCNPGAMNRDGWDRGVNNSEDKCKSRFFAHLLHEGLITPKDIQDCNLNLGKYGHEIAAEAQKRGGRLPAPGK